jgi:hypothetical protein
MKSNPTPSVCCLLALLLAAAILAGCTGPSSETVAPKTSAATVVNLKAVDCFFRLNDSAHSMNTGSSQQITISGYVSNICRQPMENLVVHATFSDKNGKTFATAERFVGHVGYHQAVPFNLTIDTQYSDLYTFDLQPYFQEKQAFF